MSGRLQGVYQNLIRIQWNLMSICFTNWYVAINKRKFHNTVIWNPPPLKCTHSRVSHSNKVDKLSAYTHIRRHAWVFLSCSIMSRVSTILSTDVHPNEILLISQYQRSTGEGAGHCFENAIFTHQRWISLDWVHRLYKRMLY